MTQVENHIEDTSASFEFNMFHYGVAVIAFLGIFGVIYCVFKGRNKKSKYKVKLIEKHSITHDTVILTFLLPTHEKSLGLNLGEHLEI
jgi:hypothetical protein